MSGIWYDGKWYENTGRICRRCGKPVYESDLKERGYVYQCFHHDEDLFSFETDEATAPPRVIVARHYDGITINTALEHLLDDSGELLIFSGQPEAAAYLLSHSLTDEDMEFLYFIDYDGLPDEPEE